MSAIIIQADSKNNKLLKSLAFNLGAKVFSIEDEQFEDFALGKLMDNVKSSETVSRETIMNQLNQKIKR